MPFNLPPYDGDEPTALAYTPDAPPEPRDEDTFLLALESIQRWSGRYRVSPAMRLRAIKSVVEAALADQSV